MLAKLFSVIVTLCLLAPMLRADNPKQTAGKYVVELKMPIGELVAQKTTNVELRVTGNDESPAINAKIDAAVTMPAMAMMPAQTPKVQKGGIPGDYKIALTFPHAGAYSMTLTVTPLGEPAVKVTFPLTVAAAGNGMENMANMAGIGKMGGMKMTGGMSMMDMRATSNLADPMNREGSGTSWLPDSTPIYGQMTMRGRDMLMAHGAITPRYVNIGSKRGDRDVNAPSWFMGMFAHPLDGPSQAAAKDQIGVRVMLSADPFTVGGYGYPLLFQTGESWHGKALVDRQHPHDLFSELAVVYSRKLDSKNSAYAYVGYPGEPALGPPTFMHRLIALELPDAPLGHHWTDSEHITFGVATLGVKLGPKFKLEGSNFTGREPDENRYSFDKPRFDSYSGRLSFNPDANNALQISYGFLKSPESREPDSNENRTTASWIYNKPLGVDANFTTSLVWGLINVTDEGRSNALLLESVYQRGANSLFARIENVQKSGHEFDFSGPLEDRKFKVGAYTAGYLRDVSHGKGLDAGIGAAVTLNTKPAALDSVYGGGSPVSFQIMFRLRPSRMKMDGMSMTGMNMMGN